MKGQSGKDMVSKIKKPKQKFQSFQDTILIFKNFGVNKDVLFYSHMIWKLVLVHFIQQQHLDH